MQEISDLLNFSASVILVLVTTAYVYITKRILEETREQLKLSYIPVLGINLDSIGISEVFGPNRRNMSARFSMINVGNAPAIDIKIDGEIVLHYSNINGETEISSRFEPAKIPFCMSVEKITDFRSPSFGNTCIMHIFDDFRECSRLNTLRIEKNPSQEPYMSTKMRLILYYRNSLNQYFESVYEVDLGCDKIPESNESKNLHIYPDPFFHSSPISEAKMRDIMTFRDEKRELCGW